VKSHDAQPVLPINAVMTVLDIVARWPSTQDVFKSHDQAAGECIMCQALFETVQEVCRRYGLDEQGLVEELNRAAGNGASGSAD